MWIAGAAENVIKLGHTSTESCCAEFTHGPKKDTDTLIKTSTYILKFACKWVNVAVWNEKSSCDFYGSSKRPWFDLFLLRFLEDLIISFSWDHKLILRWTKHYVDYCRWPVGVCGVCLLRQGEVHGVKYTFLLTSNVKDFEIIRKISCGNMTNLCTEANPETQSVKYQSLSKNTRTVKKQMVWNLDKQDLEKLNPKWTPRDGLLFHFFKKYFGLMFFFCYLPDLYM